jgi:hypothetical protein
MKAVCPLHGPTTIVGTNAYGFPIYACCCDDVPNVMPPDACTREPAQQGSEQPRVKKPEENEESRWPAPQRG